MTFFVYSNILQYIFPNFPNVELKRLSILFHSIPFYFLPHDEPLSPPHWHWQVGGPGPADQRGGLRVHRWERAAVRHEVLTR